MKILVAGDFSPCDKGNNLIKSKIYGSEFEPIINLTNSTDFSIVNFETTIPSSGSAKIYKVGPCLSTEPESLNFLQFLGFNVVTLANNHFYDFGDLAVDNTLEILDKHEILHVGGGRNINEASKILYLHKGSEIVAVINACEHEFSIATDEHGGSNPINLIDIYYSIQEAKKNADYVLCIFHGGHEYFQLPSIRMQKWYRYFVDSGADVVINHHQHCYSGMEIYKNKPIYYGLGNFLFDEGVQNEITSWNEGFLIEIEFLNGIVTTREIPYQQCFNDFSIKLLGDDKNFNLKFHELNEIISDSRKLKEKINLFYVGNTKGYKLIFEPYHGRIFKAAYLRGLMPSFLSKSRLLSVRNYIECESHLDRLRYIIKSNLK